MRPNLSTGPFANVDFRSELPTLPTCGFVLGGPDGGRRSFADTQASCSYALPEQKSPLTTARREGRLAVAANPGMLTRCLNSARDVSKNARDGRLSAERPLTPTTGRCVPQREALTAGILAAAID